MEKKFGSDDVTEISELSQDRLDMILKMAQSALESGLIPRRDDLTSDYIDALLPA